MTIQRYDMISMTRCGEAWQELQPEQYGDWMRFPTHEATVRQLEQEADSLRQQLAALQALVRQLLDDNRIRGYIHPCFAAKLKNAIIVPQEAQNCQQEDQQKAQ